MGITELLWRFPSAQMAWRNLGRNRIRTALASLGIVIGVISIASLGITGVAIQQQATSDLGSLTNEVTITSGEDSSTAGVTADQVDEVRNVAGNVDVVPQYSDATTISSRNGQEENVSVIGLTQANVLYDVSAGESPERLQSGVLLTDSTANQLGIEIGDPIEYNGQMYRVRGLIESDQGFGGGGRGQLVVPESALSDRDNYDSVTIVTEDGDAATEIAAILRDHFNEETHNGEVDEELSITDYSDVQENINSFMNTLRLALLGIGSISLVVASVAILNVMLMSTIERRGEIGVLRAVGIRRGEVLRMILIEAAFLGAIGGLAGVLISLVIGLALFQVLAGDAMIVFEWESARYLVYGFLFAIGASVVSGLYPAWKAANDRPVEALRG